MRGEMQTVWAKTALKREKTWDPSVWDPSVDELGTSPLLACSLGGESDEAIWAGSGSPVEAAFRARPTRMA